MTRPFGHKRVLARAGPPPFREFSHGSRLGAQRLGRDYRRGHGLRRGLSGERRVRAFGVGFVHHRAGLALAGLVAGPNAGAARARHHDDGDRRCVSRLCVARRMGLWPRERVSDRRFRALPSALRARHRLARRPRNFRRRAMERAFQRQLAPALGGPDHRPRQHHPQLLADRPSVRHPRLDGSRCSAPTGESLPPTRDLSDPPAGERGDGGEDPQVHGSAHAS